MTTPTKPAKNPASITALKKRISITEDDRRNILHILFPQKPANSLKKEVIEELENRLRDARNHFQNARTSPIPQNIKASIAKFLKNAEEFEGCLEGTIFNVYVRCEMQNHGRRYIDPEKFHADLLELIYQSQKAIEKLQDSNKANGGKLLQKRLRSARIRIKRDLENFIYNKYYSKNRAGIDKKDRTDFWKICKTYIETSKADTIKE